MCRYGYNPDLRPTARRLRRPLLPPRAGRERTTGAGILTLPDGGRHEGEYRGGRGMEWPEVPHGQGVLTYRDGGRYEGAFEDGKQHDQGILTMPDGMRHEGEFRDGEPV